jgi:serine protease Do
MTRARPLQRVPAPMRVLAVGAFAALGAATAAAAPAPASAQVPPTPDAAKAVAAAAPVPAERFFEAIVKVNTRAVPNARSTATLGHEREGTGIVIGKDGLILTIGYLIVEADDVKVVDARGRTLPARVVGYDHPTGLGLLRTVVPLDAPPVPLGDSAALAVRDPVMIVNHEGESEAARAYVVSRRSFTGSWEYLLEQAIFTAPATANWSGAALVSRDFKLVGVGSLIVRDAIGGESEAPGNMFVPIDALKPILSDLVKFGRRAGPARPWLGVAAEEMQGRLVLTRVSPGGPADRAGLAAGDIILGVGSEGVRTQAEFYRKLWGQGAAGTEIRLRVLQGIDLREITVRSIDRVEYFRPRTTH